MILELISHGDSAEKDYSITVKFSAIWGHYNLSYDIIVWSNGSYTLSLLLFRMFRLCFSNVEFKIAQFFEYKSKIVHGSTVKVTVDYRFENISDLESISQFPHAQRRTFAKYSLEKFWAERFHRLTEKDILDPFAS